MELKGHAMLKGAPGHSLSVPNLYKRTRDLAVGLPPLEA